jgi:ribosome-associated heat shock protein Hsp15
MEQVDEPRLDKWLWAVRLFKTRTQATEACRGGAVKFKGEPAKPAREVRVGDVFEVRQGGLTKTVKVRAPLERRVGAKLVEGYMEDLTPASEYLRHLQSQAAAPWKREPGAGRPTKKDRRQLEEFMGGPWKGVTKYV